MKSRTDHAAVSRQSHEPEEPALSDGPPIDLPEFRAAMRVAGIEEVVEPILILFAQEAPKGLAAITAAMSAGDMDGLRRAAHSLKSSAGNVRAKALAGVLQELENAAEALDQARAAKLTERVVLEHDAVLKYLAEHQAGG